MASGANLAQAWFSISWIIPVVVVLGILFVLAAWRRRRQETGTVFSGAVPEPDTEERAAPRQEKECEIYVPLGPSGRSDRDADVHVPCDVPHPTDM